MRAKTHNNLFQFGDKREVYQTLQRDYDRDTWVHGFWHFCFVVAAFGGVVVAGETEWLWLFLGGYALERALARWVDNSNRNWAMHLIDWIEVNQQPRDERW